MEPVQNNDYCLNCGTELHGSFCHRCGQRDLPKRQTLWELVENYIGSTFSFESKFFRSVTWLLFRPGYLPVEYTSGRREHYYHPVRAYAFISLIFFFLLFDVDRGETERSFISAGDYQKFWESVYAGSGLTKFRDVQAYDSIQAALPAERRDGFFATTFNRNSLRLMDRYTSEGGWQAFRQDLWNELEGNYPKVFFLMLPLVALILQLLYLRRDFLYSEHLVFTLYYYNFIYLMASLISLGSFLPAGGPAIAFVGNCWMALYLPLAMKRMYRQGWRTVGWKCLLLAAITLTFLAMGSIANIVFSLARL